MSADTALALLASGLVLLVGWRGTQRGWGGQERHPDPPLGVSTPGPVARALGRADIALDPGQAIALWLAGLCVGLVGGLTIGSTGWLLAGLLGAGPGVAVFVRRNRSDQQVVADLPELLDMVARTMRSGASLRTALVASIPHFHGGTAADLRVLREQTRGGMTLRDSLMHWQQRRPQPAVSLTVTALLVAADAGGSAAQAIDRVAVTVREQDRLRNEVRSLASQAQMSAALIALLPVVFGLGAGLTDSRTASFLLASRTGLVCLGLGLTLDLLALLWMRRIVAAVVV